MKKICILIMLISAVFFQSFSQKKKTERLDENGKPIVIKKDPFAKFAPDAVIIKFTDGYLDITELEKDVIDFDLESRLVQHEGIKTKFREKSIVKLTKVVRKFKPHQKISTARSGEEISIPDFYNLMLAKVPSGTDIEKLCDELSDMEGIDYAEPDYILPLDGNPNDTYFILQKGFEQTTDKDIDAARAWDFTTGNYTVKVGIIDGGIDYHNYDLGNGAFGYEGAKVRGGWDFYDNDNNPDDANGHGTAVAGIIGAIRNNSTGVAGLAGGDGSGNIGCQLFAFRTGYDGLVSSLNIDAIIEAAAYTPTFGYGCHILSNSWGSYSYNESLRMAVNFAAKNNVVVVASKGNDGVTTNRYPADYDGSWVLATGASDENDSRVYNYLDFGSSDPWSSNYGNNLDVMAPGTTRNVYTTTLVGYGNYGAFSGTSAAVPHISGLAALIKSINPNLHVNDVEGIIKASTDDIKSDPNVPGQDLTGYDIYTGYGRINAGKAMEMMQAPWAMNQYTSTGGSVVSSTGTYTTTFFGVSGLADGNYIVKRHTVQSTVNIGDGVDTKVWGRGVNATVGFSGAAPNYGAGYCNVVSYSNTAATLQTNVYEVWTVGGTYKGYYPTTPANVTLAYTVLRKPITPLTAYIEGPDCVNKGKTGTWSAEASGGNGTYSYLWTRTSNGAVLSTARTLSLTVNTDFGITLQVTSGSQTVTKYGSVMVCTGGGGGGGCEFAALPCLTKAKSKESLIPDQFELSQSYPNPANPSATINFAISEPSNVTLKIYNIQGQEVRTLFGNFLSAGYYDSHWNGLDDAGNQVASGTYIYRLQAGKFIQSKKLLLVK